MFEDGILYDRRHIKCRVCLLSDVCGKYCGYKNIERLRLKFINYLLSIPKMPPMVSVAVNGSPSIGKVNASSEVSSKVSVIWTL